jgi:RHH-type proline utilization regulon transcriptional repressor/proline dehydrogenase/delta 1-pyrroline-5-carboxylate dehydrogenase
MVKLLWKAGIPREVVQFVACPDNEIGRGLVTDPRTNGVILTGAYETGRMFQSWKPEMELFAETSGKNSLIITSAADPDQAVKDLVKSAFGHAGQKCSAASLAIIEADLYDNPNFMRQLRDAAASLKVGSAWDESSIVTPVIREPDRKLKRALTKLDDNEKWLLEPQMIDDNPCLWSPGIKLGIDPKSWYRRTECFGPVLGIIRVNNLEQAIRIQNDSDFGLTGGIHTLDAREIAQWRDQVEVGNAYINRSITGAIVQRQPFGGWKNSCFGPGAKAGGPNYVSILGEWSQEKLPATRTQPDTDVGRLLAKLTERLPESAEALAAASESYAYWWKVEFSKEHDPTQLHGETNHFRYRPRRRILFRAEGVGDEKIGYVLLAAATCSVALDISIEKVTPVLSSLGHVVIEETEIALIKRLRQCGKHYTSLRVLNPSVELQRAANDAALQMIRCAPLANGRLELLAYLREQSISETTHRYGNIIPKASELLLNK